MVPGEGPLPSLGMIVGEAPGPLEWDEGRPFVGPSGALLDQALATVDVQRSDLYVTNIVKVWPRDADGKTRRPNQDELDVWLPVFEAELEQCSPAATLLLGKTAAEAMNFSPGDAETDNVFAAWHPAYVLRQRAKYNVWIEQIKLWASAYHTAVERA